MEEENINLCPRLVKGNLAHFTMYIKIDFPLKNILKLIFLGKQSVRKYSSQGVCLAKVHQAVTPSIH